MIGDNRLMEVDLVLIQLVNSECCNESCMLLGLVTRKFEINPFYFRQSITRQQNNFKGFYNVDSEIKNNSSIR